MQDSLTTVFSRFLELNVAHGQLSCFQIHGINAWANAC